MEIRVWEKGIQNPPESPWLDWIEKGIKEYEGRVFKSDWAKICEDDVILFSDGKKVVKTKVTEIKHFADFSEAYRCLGKKLVPIEECTSEEVVKIYHKYFSEEDIKKYGVVAVGVKSMNSF